MLSNVASLAPSPGWMVRDRLAPLRSAFHLDCKSFYVSGEHFQWARFRIWIYYLYHLETSKRLKSWDLTVNGLSPELSYPYISSIFMDYYTTTHLHSPSPITIASTSYPGRRTDQFDANLGLFPPSSCLAHFSKPLGITTASEHAIPQANDTRSVMACQL